MVAPSERAGCQPTLGGCVPPRSAIRPSTSQRRW
jgi:hypothetical protein